MLSRQPYGMWLLLMVALGLNAFVRAPMSLTNPEVSAQEVAKDQESETHTADPIEWVLIEDPPPNVPVPAIISNEHNTVAVNDNQLGVSVMVHWIIDGESVSRDIKTPFPWPDPIAIRGDYLTIDLGTAVAPIEVEARVFQTIDDNGLPTPPSPALWCKYLSLSSGCRITRADQGENWKIVIELPADPGATFVSLRGSWGLPSDYPPEIAPDWSRFDAAWLFAIDNG